ncbi:helix-turn-helix domain-containing protein [Kibdelosporangium persicum]|uniref:helix-turn-helix domain-containing protein n=1 Tax=Kibdelosporangium persicum TaxID=2698649 RepID=UPI0028ADA0E2|nr:helix-turn-helix transcriptional regulator [Kibdelosporangium persicum]
MPSRPTFLRRKLGAKLRRMREQAGLSLDEAASRLDKTRSALHRVETGETRVDVHLARSIMDVYDIFDTTLLDEVRQAFKPPWHWAYGIKRRGYVDAETEAARVHEYVVLDMPGLLQTKAYMRALFAGGIPRSEQVIDRDITVRTIRQYRLTDPDRPLELVVVVHEAALHRELGGREVMRAQLWHLIEMSQLTTVTLQVLPLSQGAHLVPNAPFFVLSFADEEDPELLHVEHPGGSIQTEEPAEVQAAKLAFEQAQSVALSPADSIALLERLAVELYGL